MDISEMADRYVEVKLKEHADNYVHYVAHNKYRLSEGWEPVSFAEFIESEEGEIDWEKVEEATPTP